MVLPAFVKKKSQVSSKIVMDTVSLKEFSAGLYVKISCDKFFMIDKNYIWDTDFQLMCHKLYKKTAAF